MIFFFVFSAIILFNIYMNNLTLLMELIFFKHLNYTHCMHIVVIT